ncbi:AraC family transcriptional regulator [Nocardia sp. XZ_19_369]|uniref:helix-turn-helix transcriptional regulator n=1 Tax=Nocardia sp. XZ_19_369 TaxID=2769487 RepID=UPI00188F247F|nr:helix-turn-helix domain-containing protein [Nocardia sp. XZ_19_369]
MARVGAPAEAGLPIQLSGRRPLTAGAGHRLARVVEHLRQVAADPAAGDLVAATSADYLVATVLDTMPTTVAIEPTAADRRDAHPDAVRRALAYLESHLRDDLSVADIATASSVTVRALQLAFRRHLDTTPLAHLRRLRLDAARQQLRAAGPGNSTTVTAVAYDWGFTHPGRFAVAYKRTYGEHPSRTLHS